MNFIFLHDRLVEATQARVHVDERGFRFGDGVFETIPVYSGIPYLLHYHMERFEKGLQALKIHCNQADVHNAISALISANKMQDGLLRVYASRGVGSQGYLPTFPASRPTLVIQSLPLPSSAPLPLTIWLSGYERPSPQALPGAFKLAQGLNSTLARMEAMDHGCDEALLLSQHQKLCEASAGNLFWRKKGALFTPALTTGALAGVTRRRLIEASSLQVIEGEYGLETLADADEVFLTNASRGIIPVEKLLPQGWTWSDHSTAQQFAQWRQDDIMGNAPAKVDLA